ncbi:CheW-like protein domain protein [Rhodopirellula maiorica SM1]|uniref:CheW-like protein domain protein n=1 Tax=Rhodopirellula maiorica SM1 TaxID=1265738 RepID=M5RRV4_9BACT|nr:chemotaxis protein CheW [Rhodopirellula maiorica]EMI22020.1 CheW-like protein domain protein [Rhodopirellula maiorica SM1]
MIAADKKLTKTFDWDAAKRRLEESGKTLLDSESLPPEQTAKILDERARELARVPDQTLDNRETLEVVRFRIGNEEFAIGSEFVLELTFPNSITPIPQLDPHFVGVINLRGEVTTVIDLGKLLGISADDEQKPQALVLGRDRPEFAILVSGIEHVVALRRDDLREPMGVTGGYRDLMLGCSKDGVLVLGGEALLGCEELYVDQSE